MGVLLVAALAGCEGQFFPSEERQREQAEARWAARPFGDYVIEQRNQCFCPAGATQWSRVEVRGDTVSRVIVLETGEELRGGERAIFETVDQLFGEIRRVQQSGGSIAVEVEYDRQLGFPRRVQFLAEGEIADGGGLVELRSARAVTP